MKKFFMLIIGLIMLCGARAQWIPQKSGTTNNLYSIYFTDIYTGYAAGYGGTILKTSDGGLNWTVQGSGTDAYLFEIYFQTSSRGFAVGYGIYAGHGILLATSNGGETWEKLQDEIIDNGEWFSIDFINSFEGYIAGTYNGKGCILKTSDSGNTWSAFFINVEDSSCYSIDSNLNSIHFIDSNTGFASGSYYCGSQTMGQSVNLLLKSSNAGVDWEQVNYSQNFDGMGSLFFTDPLTGYMIGGKRWGWGEGYDSLVKTIDGGINWFTSKIGTDTGYVQFESLFFTDSDTGFISGGFGKIFKTEDGGESYFLQNSGTTKNLNSVFFTDSHTGYIAGDSGTILKTINGGGPSIGIENPEGQRSEIKVQSYPNPFVNFTTLEYELENSANVNLSIYNHLGNCVAMLVEERQSAGKYHLVWNASLLSSGVYYIRLITENNIRVEKLLKIKL